MAMALEEGGWFGRNPVTIHASDASAAALQKAREGIYRGRSFRNLPSQLKTRYFREDSEGQRVSPSLHDRIRWHRANLMVDEEIRSMAESPFIFCRNVFIYFSKESIKKTVALFHRHMPTPGFLFTGASESLLTITRDFELEEIGGAFVYVKR
jgi:chemotaxis protein methyltransferase CheR